MQFVEGTMMFDTAKSELIHETGVRGFNDDYGYLGRANKKFYKTPSGRFFRISETQFAGAFWGHDKEVQTSHRVFVSPSEAASFLALDARISDVEANRLCGVELSDA